jgi:C4-dicarboxylate transporter DctM subunit
VFGTLEAFYRVLVSFFGLVEGGVNAIDRFLRNIGRVLRDRVFHHVGFWLILLLTALRVVVGTVCSELDRLLSKIERWFIAVAMLVMTALSFLDYLRREIDGFEFEVDGGPNFAVVLMVWVGFFGASLATRQRKHLAVDLSERLLSPAVGRVVQRFSALLAAGFCWTFSGYAQSLMNDSLLRGATQETLPLWPELVGAVDALSWLLLSPDAPIVGLLATSTAILTVVILTRRQLTRGQRSIQPAMSMGLDFTGSIALLVGGLALVGMQWQPETAEGTPYAWSSLAERAEADKPDEADVANIANLVGADTGTDANKDEAASAELVAAMAEASTRQNIPTWIPQAILPLSFLLMALRFFGLAITGTPTDPNAPPVPTKPTRSTGRGRRDLIFAGLIPGFLLGVGAVIGVSTGWLVLIACILVVLTGAPLFLAIGIGTVASVTYIQDLDAALVAKDMFEAVKKEELLAIPFFVLAGNIMTQGTIADRLVGVAKAMVGRMPGGLGVASIAACVVFAAISGSSPVTVIAVGGIMFPMLVKDRYPEDYSLGVLTSAGSLGIIIPPSVPMIIYAIMVSGAGMAGAADGEDVTTISPNDLFIAGIGPGLFIAGALLAYTLYQTRPTRTDIDIVVPELEGGYVSNLLRELRKSIWSLMLPVIVLGGIYGILGPLRFTVTEAAAVSVVYALFVELVIHREMKAKKLLDVLADSGVMMGSLFLIIVLAIAFNKFLAAEMIPQEAARAIKTAVSEPWQFLILVNLFLLALGCVMEIISAILIVAPLLAPIAHDFGIDPVHFGIIFIVNLELGYLTPPMGINLFVASTVFERPVVKVIRSSLPFLLLMLFCLVVITAFPSLSLMFLDRPTP